MIEFLSNNIVWVIVVGIVLIMAIIGYFAENSELGKKVMEIGDGTKKAKKPKKAKMQEPLQTQTFEEVRQNIDPNAGIASAISGDTEILNNNIIMDNIETIGEVETPANDAWTNNVDTNIENSQEVVETSPNEWLNAPVDLSIDANETTDSGMENLQANSYPLESPTLEGSEDALFNMPETGKVLPEVAVDELPNEDFSNIEVLDIEKSEGNFDDVEILNTEENDYNPVEQALAKFGTANSTIEIPSVNNEGNQSEQPTLGEIKTEEAPKEDIWK